MKTIHALALLAAAALAMPIRASTYSVGSGACTHSTVAAALATAAGDATPGPHLIKLQTGEFVVANVSISNPQQDLTLQGGYAQCGDAAPAAGQRSTLRSTAASGARVLSLSNSVSSDRRTIALQNLTVRGGRNPSGTGGGGIFATGKLSLLLQAQTRINDNIAGNGGGVQLLTLTSDPSDFTLLRLEGDSSIEDNQATGLGGNGYGGGVDCIGGCRVLLWDGSVSFNTARLAGGAIAVRTDLASLAIDPGVGAELVVIGNNTAGRAAFSSDEGFGGAIYSDEAPVSGTVFGGNTDYAAWIFNNTANYGGAFYGAGPQTGTRTAISVMNAFVFNNIARSRGGALYSRNGVEWTFDHQGTGDCPIIGGRRPCSYFSDNEAQTADGGVGGGVAYLAADSGSLAGIAHFNRTLFEGNSDAAGLAAVAEAVGGSRLNFRRSVFRNNTADGPGVQRTLFGSAGSDIDFFYNTVLNNAVDGIFYMNGGTLRPQGSIWWAPGLSVWFPTGSATMSFASTCLVTHTTSGLSTPPGAVWVADPRLGSGFAPRGSSSALDHCSSSAPPGNDLYGRAPGVDVPGVANRIGSNDLGAVEQHDIIFANSYGNRPGN